MWIPGPVYEGKSDSTKRVQGILLARPRPQKSFRASYSFTNGLQLCLKDWVLLVAVEQCASNCSFMYQFLRYGILRCGNWETFSNGGSFALAILPQMLVVSWNLDQLVEQGKSHRPLSQHHSCPLVLFLSQLQWLTHRQQWWGQTLTQSCFRIPQWYGLPVSIPPYFSINQALSVPSFKQPPPWLVRVIKET